MKKAIVGTIGIVLLSVGTTLAEGTQTFSYVKNDDAVKTYLDISKIVITKEKEGAAAGVEKDVICFEIDGKYKITDNKELILLLFEIIKDLKSKP